MAGYKLQRWGSPSLRQICSEVRDFTDLDELVASMKSIIIQYEAIGIAAPQVGDNRRVIIANICGEKKVFVNPKIVYAEGKRVSMEGCLSLPGIIVPKIRRKSVDVEYQDIGGSRMQGSFEGLYAAVLQHETDHLDGILITDLFRKRDY